MAESLIEDMVNYNKLMLSTCISDKCNFPFENFAFWIARPNGDLVLHLSPVRKNYINFNL